MMNKSNLNQLIGDYHIYSNEKYIVLCGKELRAYRMDGTLILCREDVLYAHMVVFLPNDYLLVIWDKGSAFRMLSLRDGAELWKTHQIEITYIVDSVVSPNCNAVFCCYSWQDRNYIARVDLPTGKLRIEKMPIDYFDVKSVICNENETLCILRSHHRQVDGQLISISSICEIGLGDHSHDVTYKQKHRWELQGVSSTASTFLDGGQFVLTLGLDIYEPLTETLYSILESNHDWRPPRVHCNTCFVDKEKKRLTLYYPGLGVAIVDMDTKKVIAQYEGSLPGCVIGDEYWISAKAGLRTLPFPYYEELPKPRPIFWA